MLVLWQSSRCICFCHNKKQMITQNLPSKVTFNWIVYQVLNNCLAECIQNNQTNPRPAKHSVYRNHFVQRELLVMKDAFNCWVHCRNAIVQFHFILLSLISHFSLFINLNWLATARRYCLVLNWSNRTIAHNCRQAIDQWNNFQYTKLIK